ncbi:MAG TPA: glycosyltransferase [Roseiflexaceae bacterium]|nr:glycosyltransferase [Roseiflexaceae bacterium]
MNRTDGALFVAWAPYGRRSELLAAELGARMYFIHNLKYKVPIYAPLKYVPQSVRTLRVLLSERPRVVFVQNPPFVCGLVVWLYCLLSGARFVLDHHTDAFARRWAWARPVQTFLARRALTNLVTGSHWAETVRSWGARAFILPDPFVTLPEGEPFAVRPGFNVVFINTFAADEPTDAVVQAAARCPDVHFYITGNTARRPASYFANLPANVTFTGFLPDAQYFGLLRAAQAVMALTTRDFTLQGGGCEAVSLGKPLITSDWPFLRELFARGAVYVENTSDGICAGVGVMRQRHQELEREVLAFRQERRREWDERFAQLGAIVASAEARRGAALSQQSEERL